MASNGNASDPERGTLSPEEREALKKRASELGKRLEDVRIRKAPPAADSPGRGAAMGDAFKITAELIAGIAVGGGIGWALDRALGTGPWLFFVFLILGFAAGMSNVIKSARRMQAMAEPMQRSAPSVPSVENNDDEVDDDRPVSPSKGGAPKPGGGR
jgi:ATP synthase protein I